MNRRQGDRSTNHASRRPLGPGGVSPFVGREEELHHLNSMMTLALEGQGSTIFVSGEPGIGKTRLVQEALVLAKERGFIVLKGRAFSLEAGLAYAPVVDAFRPFLRSLDRSRLEALMSELPSFGSLFEGLRVPAQSFPPEELGDPALERIRLFESVLRFLERLTLQAPVALFIDDLHWAEPTTLDLLHYLARGLANQPVLFLATYSSDSLRSSEGLQTLVAWLERNRLAKEIVIDRLAPESVQRIAQAILGEEPQEDLLALLEARAKGTPLFIEVLIAALVDSGSLVPSPSEKGGWNLDAEGARALPPSVRRLTLVRLAQLAPCDRRVLDLIAIMGEAASYTILRAASRLDEGTLVEALHHLRVRGLVREGAEGTEVVYAITHPLIQEVVYSELSEVERRRAHLAAIEALERLRPGDVNRLAHHYCGAGSEARGDNALSALVAAGERALNICANGDAVRYFSAALALFREGQEREEKEGTLSALPGGLPGLLERLGEAYERIGKPEAAVEAWNEALAERERAGDAVASSRLRCQLAQAEWSRGHLDIAEAHMHTGIAALAGLEPCQELADLLLVKSYILSRSGDVAGHASVAAELLMVAKRLASPKAKAEANLVASHSSVWQRDVSKARERALRALMIGEQEQDLWIRCRAHLLLIMMHTLLGDHRLARSDAERGLAVAERLGSPNTEAFLRVYLAHAEFIAGAWEDSLSQCKEAVALARRVGYPRYIAFSLAEQAMILAFQGHLREAETCISDARSTFGSGVVADRFVFSLVDIAETALALELGQGARALDISRGFARQPDPAATLVGLTIWLMPIGLMLLSEAQVAAGEPERALETASKIAALGPTGTPYLTALASRAEGLAYHCLGQEEVASACLIRAYELFTSLEIPFQAARSLLEHATIMASAQPELAAKSIRQSLAVFDRVGAQRYAERAHQLLHTLGVSPFAAWQPRLGGVPVSERELEIARLVAQGLTTAEIAKRLTISPSTVSVHLSRIYTRLGIGSRTALGRMVFEAGLL